MELYPPTDEEIKKAQQLILDDYEWGYWSYGDGSKRLLFTHKEERANWVIKNQVINKEIGFVRKASREELKKYRKAEEADSKGVKVVNKIIKFNNFLT